MLKKFSIRQLEKKLIQDVVVTCHVFFEGGEMIKVSRLPQGTHAHSCTIKFKDLKS
jgi:hypothetical protein